MSDRMKWFGGAAALALCGLVVACGQSEQDAPTAEDVSERVQQGMSAAREEAAQIAENVTEASGELADDAEQALAEGVEAAGELADEVAAETAEAADAVRLAAVLAHPRRADDRARDDQRHPGRTLRFFGVTPEMTVAEVLPGGGWYTRVVAPYVADDGRYIGLNYSTDLIKALFGDRLTPEFLARVEAFPEAWPAQVDEMAGSDVDVVGAYAFGSVPAEAAGQADAVLVVRALHNLAAQGEMDAAIADIHALLKPGGVAGVVQHRAKADAPADYADGSKGYLKEADVIAAFEAAGFVLEEASDINANPADAANWPMGVWTLPPALRTGEDEDTYKAIGESDRMTLRFRKPA